MNSLTRLIFPEVGMSRTLFWYVFRELIRVFLLASGVIAGIMSFGGLLKPLMDNGLDLGQVGRMLAYAMPAMTTYSYPIAALFATTVVYGRLSSDNEVTAVRAAGISLGPLGLGLPALVGGVIVSIMSLFFLSFVVPAATLQVERTVVSNLGQMVVNRITQQHQVHLVQSGSQPMTIFARSAWLEPSVADAIDSQVVHLEGVSIVNYAKATGDKKLQVPEEFYIAKEARAYIRQPPPAQGDAEESPVQMRATMSEGMKFPRVTSDGQNSKFSGGVKTQQFGPFPLQSPLKENTKFMTIRRLQYLQQHPEQSQRMQDSLANLIQSDQQHAFLENVRRSLLTLGTVQFETISHDRFSLRLGSQVPVYDKTRLVLGTAAGGTESVHLVYSSTNLPSAERVAREVRLRVFPGTDEAKMYVTIELQDAALIAENGEKTAARDSFERSFTVPMSPDIQAISGRTVEYYLKTINPQTPEWRLLSRNWMKQTNSVLSEMHSRVSFALSCIVLTLVGYGLGVMFKSGNYLNAFAVSVAPAIVSIVLIVTGQHICENIPPDLDLHKFHDPLGLGLSIIWAGNIMVLALAVGLLARLRRT